MSSMRFGATVLGFVGGVVFVASCGGGGESAVAQSADPIRTLKITRVLATTPTSCIRDGYECEVTAICPVNTVVTGGGCFDDVGGNDESRIRTSFPADSASWTCKMMGGGGLGSSPLKLNVYALCLGAEPGTAISYED